MKPGDKVQQFDNICEVQSDKASVTITSRYDGTIKTLHYKIDDVCPVGSALVDIELASEEENSNSPEPSSKTNEEVLVSSQPTQSELVYDKVLTTPAVRKIAKENSVDLKKVHATGRDGRVLKEDILAYLGKVARSIDAEETPKISDTPRTPSPLADKKYAKHMWKSMTQSLVRIIISRLSCRFIRNEQIIIFQIFKQTRVPMVPIV